MNLEVFQSKSEVREEVTFKLVKTISLKYSDLSLSNFE